MGFNKSIALDVTAINNLENALKNDIENGLMYGASVIVARGGEIGYKQTFGEAEPGRPMKEHDIFLMMSLSKSFSAALVLRAIDEGRFTFDTKVSEIIPEFAFGGKQNVTVYQMLNHTAGTWGELLPPPPMSPQEVGDLGKYVEAVSKVPLAYVPGTKLAYTPTSTYAVLSQMVVLTDPKRRTSFAQIAREDLFSPLGMTEMHYGISPENTKRIPVSHTPEMTTPTTGLASNMLNNVTLGNAVIPAVNAYGTIDDVFAFTEAIRLKGRTENYRLYSESIFDYASQNHTGDMFNAPLEGWCAAKEIPQFPMNYSLMGGYVRGKGHHISGAGFTASPETMYAVGGGSTMWLVDPKRDLTFIFLCAGFVEGLDHFKRLSRLSDLALATAID